MPREKLFRDRVALVTGAGVRVGRALALALADHGASVAVHYNSSAAEANRVVTAIRRKGGKCMAFQANLLDDAQRMALIPAINREMGTVRILINSASLFGRLHFHDTTSQEWDENFELNLKAPFRLSQSFAAQNHHRVRGSIVNISDWRGLRPGVDHFAYTVTKAALIKMTESTALALAPRIRVNCLALGIILPPAKASRQKMRELVAATPLKKKGSPSDVVAALVYLLGPGTYVTGETIVLDGGRQLVA